MVYHYSDKAQTDLISAWHVDDGTGWGTKEAVEFLRQSLEERFKVKFEIIPMGCKDDFAGVESVETVECLKLNQHAYIKHKLKGIEMSSARAKQRSSKATEEERGMLRTTVGQLRWVHKTILDYGYDLSRLSSWMSSDELTVDHLVRANKVVGYVKAGRPVEVQWGQEKEFELQGIVLPRLDGAGELKVVAIGDAGEPKNDAIYRGKWQSAYAIGIAEDDAAQDSGRYGPVYWKMGVTRRVANSSYDGESLVGLEAVDVGLCVSDLCAEFAHGPRLTLYESHAAGMPLEDPDRVVPLELHTDSKDLVDATTSITYTRGMEKRRRGDVFDLQDLQEHGRLKEIVKIKGTTNPLDAGTKKMTFEATTMYQLRSLAGGEYRPDLG